MQQVLRWLLENQLFVKAAKCEFHQQTVSFPGFVSRGNIQMDLAKVSVVRLTSLF